jgi:hypothetical protein
MLFLDNEEIGISPLLDPLHLGPGAHVLVVRLDGFREAQVTFELQPAELRTLTVTLEPLATEPVPAGPAGAPGGGGGEEEEEGGVLSSWWFWTIIGVVVVGGAATATVLLWPEEEDPAEWAVHPR